MTVRGITSQPIRRRALVIELAVVRLFGATHLAWLGAIACCAATLAFASRRKLLPQPAVRVILGCALAAGEFARLPPNGLHFPDRLPLNLCNISTWCCVFACFTLTPWAAEFAYFAGLSGSGAALLTPDMGTSWPAQFFFNHGGIIIVASTLVFGRTVRLRSGAMWRAYGMLVLYGAAAGAFNAIFGTNYSYLRAKPDSATLFSLMGPWPIYILSTAALGLALFWLLSLFLAAGAIESVTAPSEPGEILRRTSTEAL